MKKQAVSTIVATVFVVLLAVLAVTILFTFVMPTVNDNLAEATQEKVELSIQTSGGYTIWDSTNKLAKVQVKRGNDNNDLEGINFKFYKNAAYGSQALEHTSTDIPTQGQVKTYSFILGDFGKPEGIKITANIRKANGDVVEEVIPTGQTEAGEFFASGSEVKNGDSTDTDLTNANTVVNLTFGNNCGAGSQCESGFCFFSLCTNESGLAAGGTCTLNSSCLSGFCADASECFSTDCETDSDCSSGSYCIEWSYTCVTGDVGAECVNNADCDLGFCYENDAECVDGENGSSCDNDDDCISNSCIANVCAAEP